MRSLFGVSQDNLLLGLLALTATVAIVLGTAAWRNPLLPRLAWRNVPRRPGFAALITLGLTIGTVILSSAFTTGDTMSQSVRTVVAGVLGSADEVAFIPAPVQRSGFDLAQSIASGSLLTGVTAYFPQADAQRIEDLVRDDPRVAAVVPIALEQAAVSSEGQSFAAQINLLGTPPQNALVLRPTSNASQTLTVDELAPDEVYLNTEAATALGVSIGQRVHAYGLPSGAEATWTVRDVTRLGDLGGGQATIFLPLARLQDLVQRPEQVNQVLIVNRGDPAERLQSSWPVTVELRAPFVDDATARRLFRALSSPPARELLGRAISSPDVTGFLGDKLRRLQVNLDDPAAAQNPEFRALIQDPVVLGRLASRLGGAVNRGNTPFAASATGGSGFRIVDVQSVAQDQADRWGSAFTDLFVVLGAFSLFSGMLLIVLVFSLVALERRTELGITRALGARRREVILLLAIEGGLYSLLSSLFGLGAGLGLALGIISLAQGLVEQYGFHLEPVVEPASVAASYGLGVVLTFVAVTATAWRSSRFSIVTAIRDQPDPVAAAPGWRALVVSLLPTVAGPLLVVFAVLHRLSLAYAGGVALAIVGVALLARWILLRAGLPGPGAPEASREARAVGPRAPEASREARAVGPERVVFTLAGVALIGWWLLPVSLFPQVVEMSFLSGVTMLLGAVWVVAYNVGLLRRLPAPSGLWRLSTAYVAANRFRTGLTLAMFALVVLSLTVSAVMLTATRLAYADPEAVTGGWDIHAQSTLPPRDLRADLLASGVISPDAFTTIGAASPLQVEGIQIPAGGTTNSATSGGSDTPNPGPSGNTAPNFDPFGLSRRAERASQSGIARWAPVNVVAVDDAFVAGVRTPLVGGSPDAWHALSQPGKAIVGAGLLRPGTTRLRVEDGEGADFRNVVLWLRDTRETQRAVRVEAVGLADARGPFGTAVVVNGATLAGWPPPDNGGYYLSVPPGANAREFAAGLNLSAADLKASTIGDELRLVQGVRGLLNMILQGFMGVGLLAGVAALGTLSTRAVVERRRQIGVLRALGFTARAVSAGLLVESGVVALLGAGLGVGVGLFVAQSTITFLSRVNPELVFAIPWEQIALVLLLSVGAALLMTILPARQAAKLTPAEALREA